jgi:hypothetical protein
MKRKVVLKAKVYELKFLKMVLMSIKMLLSMFTVLT